MAFEPIRTERLLLRPSLLSDADAAYERRSLPEVGRYQVWEMPYDPEQAAKGMAKLVTMDGPADGQDWSLTVVDGAAPDQILGDLYVGIKRGGRNAEIGYTFHPDHWGRGYASEAAQAIVRYLFLDFGVSRVEASLHPDNPASARVLEACGMTFEGLMRQSFWVGDECSDDMIYGMTRSAWDSWRDRPRHRPNLVELVPISPDNSHAVARLVTHKSQERFVSPMLDNFRDALAPPSSSGTPVEPWHRAISADGDIVGFVMASGTVGADESAYLWRLLIDRAHQRRGIGTTALDLLEQRFRDQKAAAIGVSWVDGPGSPGPMYLARGYEPTGEIEDGEIRAIKRLQ